MYGGNVDWIGRQRGAIRVANPSAKGPSLFQAVDHRVMINGTYDLRMAVDPRPICTMYTLRQCLRKARARARARARAHVYMCCKEHAPVFVTRAVIRAYSSHLACVHGEPARSVHTPLIRGVSRDLRFHGADERSDTIKWFRIHACV